MKTYNTLILEQNPPVLTIKLNRPAKANAISGEMMQELYDLSSQLRYETQYKFIVLSGEGRYFSSGADLGEIVTDIASGKLTPAQARLNQIDGHDLMQKFESLEQITIAAINGPIYGGGLALALGCDFRVMAQEATICIPEVARGLFFSWGSTPRLVSIVGAAKAKELIMLAEVIDSSEALRIGLVNKVVPNDQLSGAVSGMLKKLDSSPFLPIRLTKKIVNAVAAAPVGNVLLYEPELLEQSFLAEESQKEIRRFLDSKK